MTVLLSSGMLKIHLKTATINGSTTPTELSGATNAYMRLTINKMEFRSENATATSKNRIMSFDQSKELNMKNVDPKSVVKIELVGLDHSVLGTALDTMESITALPNMSKTYDMKGANAVKVASAIVMFFWSPEDNADAKKKKNNKQNVAKKDTSHTTAAVINVAPVEVLSNCPEFSRPSFMRVEYYYTTGKCFADYTKGMRMVSPIVIFGETSVNYVLGKFGIKGIESTNAIDQSLTPFISKVDSTIDTSIGSVLDALVKGQSMLLQTKDATMEQVAKTTHATYDGIVKAKEKTFSTVGSATTSTYKTVTGAAIYFISHVPILGKKVMV